MTHTILEAAMQKSQRRTLGLMSGTSADGLDIAYCDVVTKAGSLRNLASETIEYPAILREKVLGIARSGSVALGELIALSQFLGQFYADAIEKFCDKRKISKSEFELVGLHGQTAAHLAQPLPYLDRTVRGTLQIGEAEVIAKRFGVVTVSDFRNGDIAAGGSGAPLAPIYHRAIFARNDATNVVVNIGGIANITILKGRDECLATDTGPGNCLIDTVIGERAKLRFDRDGELAQKGKIDRSLVQRMLKAEIQQRQLPVSHDRGEILRLLNDEAIAGELDKLSTESALATLGELTVAAIKQAYEKMSGAAKPESVIVCGGGAHNGFLVERLKYYFSGSKVETTGAFGMDVDFVEAEAFAYLANLTLDGEPGNMPQVTGASRAAVLGKISLP
ncbi:MAG: anhydro-N-acetylmuramic acid kinase [Candidatus Zixiibacteriota bacterium]